MAKKKQDNLFAETTMSFGEHIEELRKALVHSLLWASLGLAAGFYFANSVVQMIQGPLTTALQQYEVTRAEEELEDNYSGDVPPEMWTVVRDMRLIPVEQQIDPFALVQRLKQDYPHEFGQLEISPHQFAPDDVAVKDAGKLAARLVAAGETQDEATAPGRVLWKALSAEQRAALKQIAQADPPTPPDRRRLVAILNAALDSEVIYHSPILRGDKFLDTIHHKGLVGSGHNKDIRKTLDAAFAKDAAAPAATAETADEGNATRRMNRMLIYGMYPSLIARPHLNLATITTYKPSKVRIQTLNAHEAFMIWMKAGIVTGLVFSSPFIFWHIWGFVAAGLYPHEKNYVYLFLLFSLILFMAGASLAFFFVFEPVLDFLFSFNKAMNIDPDPRISEWMGFVLFLPIGFGVSFQLPLVMLFMERIGIFTVESYLSRWRVAIVVIFVAAMFLTPADPMSMLLMAVPLTGLYFGGVLLCKLLPKMKSPFEMPEEI